MILIVTTMINHYLFRFQVPHPKMACFNVPTKSCKTHSVPYFVEVKDCNQMVKSCKIIQRKTLKKVMVPVCQDKCQIIDVPPMKDCDFETKCENIKIPYTVKEAYCSWEHKCQELKKVSVTVDKLKIIDMPY